MQDPVAEKTLYARAGEAAKILQDGLPEELRNPKVAVVCGSGLGGLQHTVNTGAKFEISYADIPGFAKSTGECHVDRYSGVKTNANSIEQS
jgi:purine-nucleoside phosphorylase